MTNNLNKYLILFSIVIITLSLLGYFKAPEIKTKYYSCKFNNQIQNLNFYLESVVDGRLDDCNQFLTDDSVFRRRPNFNYDLARVLNATSLKSMQIDKAYIQKQGLFYAIVHFDKNKHNYLIVEMHPKEGNWLVYVVTVSELWGYTEK